MEVSKITKSIQPVAQAVQKTASGAVSNAIEKGKLENSLDALANANTSLVKNPVSVINLLLRKMQAVDSDGYKQIVSILSQLKQNNIEHYNLVYRTINKTHYGGGINPGFVVEYVQELANIKNTKTLQKALDSNVEFALNKASNCSCYLQLEDKNGLLKKTVHLFEHPDGTTTTASLCHELGHAFDYNVPLDNQELAKALVPRLIKNPNGRSIFCNQRMDFLGYKPNATRMSFNTITEETFKKPAISRNRSMSKEFLAAYQKDLKHLQTLDEKQGLKKGTTFFNLLLDWNEGSYFGYYLGGKEGSKKIDFPTLRKEMTAQMLSLVTCGYTSRANFDKKAIEYFPNLYEYACKLVE